MRVGIVVVLLYLAGCAEGPPAQNPRPGPEPEDQGTELRQWTSDIPVGWAADAGTPWIALSGGCGFCSGAVDWPEFSTFVVFDDGSMLLLDHARGPEGI